MGVQHSGAEFLHHSHHDKPGHGAAGYKGYTTTQVLSANATASYYITRGIHLIEVTGIDMTFPGYQDNQHSGDSQVIYNGVTQPINPVINLNYQTIPPCNAVNANPSTGLGGVRPKRLQRAASSSPSARLQSAA